MFEINQLLKTKWFYYWATFKKKGTIIYYSLLILCILQISCDTDRNHRGYEYFPDMTYSKAYETYAPNNIYPDGKTAQSPVLGTIPRHMIPYQYPNNAIGLKMASVELKNPFGPTKENLNRGKIEYGVFCANCHGFDGRGDGNLYTSGKYPAEPPSLITHKKLKMADGNFYHTITFGSGIMGSFSSLIRPEDKWKIIVYIKNELPKKGIKKTK